MTDTLAIIGLGSAGQRHARNALALGMNVVGYDTRQATPELLRSLLPGMSIVTSLEYALEKKPLGVIIATPPETHRALVVECVKRKLPVLCEKPLACSLQEAEAIIAGPWKVESPISVGYQFRHTPSFAAIKARGFIGGHFTFHGKAWCSHTYKADLLLELSHELDIARYLFGNPEGGFASELTPDRAQVSVRFPGALYVDFDFDGTRDGYVRKAVFHDARGMDHNGHWTFGKADNDQAYIDELKDFLAVCRGEKAQPECTGEDGWWALRIVEAIKRSAGSGRWETA